MSFLSCCFSCCGRSASQSVVAPLAPPDQSRSQRSRYGAITEVDTKTQSSVQSTGIGSASSKPGFQTDFFEGLSDRPSTTLLEKTNKKVESFIQIREQVVLSGNEKSENKNEEGPTAVRVFRLFKGTTVAHDISVFTSLTCDSKLSGPIGIFERDRTPGLPNEATYRFVLTTLARKPHEVGTLKLKYQGKRRLEQATIIGQLTLNQGRSPREVDLSLEGVYRSSVESHPYILSMRGRTAAEETTYFLVSKPPGAKV